MKLTVPWWFWFGRVPEISPETLKTWLESGKPLQLVDARTEAEYCSGTIGAAWHAPVTQLPGSLEKLPVESETPVVALCLTGHRSRPVVRLLRRKRIEAYSLRGGVRQWRRMGYPLQEPGECR